MGTSIDGIYMCDYDSGWKIPPSHENNHQNHVAENLGEPEVTQNEKYESETCQVLHASEGYS